MFELLGFYSLSGVVLGFFAIAVIAKDLLYALSALACGMVFLSGHYFLLDAHFVGAAQIVVYSGAVLGLYSFAMMFFDLSSKIKERGGYIQLGLSLFMGFAFLLFILVAGFSFVSKEGDLSMPQGLADTKALGAVFFSKYLLAFELLGVLLLIALICAIILSGKELAEKGE